MRTLSNRNLWLCAFTYYPQVVQTSKIGQCNVLPHIIEAESIDN